MFAADALTLGLFPPLRFYQGDMRVLLGQARLVEDIDRLGFAAVWVRDVPLFDPRFGDAGQVFDPFTYLWLSGRADPPYRPGHRQRGAFLRQPVDLAKAAASVDRLSGGRLVLARASGDRPVEFPAYGLEHAQRGERFAQGLTTCANCRMAAGTSPAARYAGRRRTVAASAGRRHPAGRHRPARQPADWLARQADGWLTYPESTVDASGPRRPAGKIRAWRMSIADGGFRPHMTNEWLDLVDDPAYPRTSLHGGYVLRTGRNGLIGCSANGVRRASTMPPLGIQFSARPAAEVIQNWPRRCCRCSRPTRVQPASMDW